MWEQVAARWNYGKESRNFLYSQGSALSALRSYLQNRCCCTICLRESHTKQILSCNRRILLFFFFLLDPSGIRTLERLWGAYAKSARSITCTGESCSWIYVQWNLVYYSFFFCRKAKKNLDTVEASSQHSVEAQTEVCWFWALLIHPL